MTAVQNAAPVLQRIEFGHLPVAERIKSFKDYTIPLTEEQVLLQTKRCLHCGTPYCSENCPLHNRAVDFNVLVRDGKWRLAWECLNATNSFPEFTSHVCPAICEVGCTKYLLEESAVGIKTVERAIIDHAWMAGWVKPAPALKKTGKKVAVVGSGPSGLACAQQLARVGHDVTVFEKAELPGGLLRFGIPDFKLPKNLIDRRVDQMEAEGVTFRCGTAVGSADFDRGVANTARQAVPAADVLAEFDAVVIAAGSESPRDLRVPGREGRGVYFALEMLQEQNRFDNGLVSEKAIDCNGCDVAIIGGGDTGSDCVGTARRQGAGKIYQLDVTSEPPVKVDMERTWPDWPRILRTSTSHEEGCERLWDSSTTEIIRDEKGEVTGIRVVKLDWKRDENGRFTSTVVPDSEIVIPCQRVLLAMGFLHPSANVLAGFGIQPDRRGNCQAGIEGSSDPFATSVEKVFACGDARSGQSLVVRAMSEGRRCARAVDRFLSGETALPLFRPQP